MKIIYSEALRQSNNLYPLAQQAGRTLEGVVGRYLLPVAAKWDRGTDEQGRPVVVLRLWDRVEKSAAHFSETELQDTATMEQRLNRLWRNWLRDNSHKRMEALYTSINDTIGIEDAGQDPQ